MNAIAVIVPVFNRASLAERALRSVRKQSLAAAEFVVVDDGSSEAMDALRADVLSGGGRWITLPENRGPAAARNAGVAETSSPWITFLDSDDEWASWKLERQLAWHQSHPDMRISQAQDQWFRKGEAILRPSHWQMQEGDLFAESVERCSITPSAVMLHRTIWDELGGFDERFRVCEDYELWLRLTREYPVGLVGGEPFVRRHGGRPDQLSSITPAMDRHRIAALLELLDSGSLSPSQQDHVLRGIKEKATILAAGAAKRGRPGRAAFYHELGQADLIGLGQRLNPIKSEAFRQMNE